MVFQISPVFIYFVTEENVSLGRITVKTMLEDMLACKIQPNAQKVAINWWSTDLGTFHW
jgi:hypothetical protein